MAIGLNYIDLEWDAASDNVQVTTYQLQRNSSTVFTGNKLYYTDTGLTANTTYSYRVRAGDAAGNWSNWSESISVTTKESGSGISFTAPFITVE